MSFTTEKITVTEITVELEKLPPQKVVQWALESFSPKIAPACSFQAEESVLIDMMHRQRGADFRAGRWW